ncbi:MAG: hypothetical protein K8T89_20750 [Planctomycetes bacterium]|nr:hypothetical protein [Planctomycetota bacterium]
MRCLLSLCLPFVLCGANAPERGFRFTADKSLPAMKNIVIVKAGEPGPGKAKHQAIVTIDRYQQLLQTSTAGPFDIWWQPKSGVAVRILNKLKLKEGEVKEIKVDNYLGIVTVRGDNQPRAALVTIAAQDDPGPGEKGHVPVQTATEYRVDMAVPDGFYSLWITPANGARSQRINDRFRVQAGKSVQLD